MKSWPGWPCWLELSETLILSDVDVIFPFILSVAELTDPPSGTRICRNWLGIFVRNLISFCHCKLPESVGQESSEEMNFVHIHNVLNF